ncbi:MAG: sodium:solute symporter family protein [Cyclobacteriaceae bacterium]
MTLHYIDILIVVVFLFITLFIGIRLKDGAGKDINSFFLGGRNMPWYLAGVSMVATTFAADTPLWVTEKIAQHGISGNWLWWNMLIGGMLTVFFFAKLWRRAEITTELELIEFRYSGKPAAFLRGAKAVYMGLFINLVIIGWVNVALGSILTIFFDVPDSHLIYYIFGIMLFVALYSLLAGLKGVIITDFIQFIIAMAGCIALAVILVNHDKIGGIAGLKDKLPAWRFDFFPKINAGDSQVYSITIGAFLTFAMVQWYMSWYPGAEPGGGGYIAQRMMSAKDEKNAMLATLFFQVVHYCIRPWPWIVTGLACLVLYPNLPLEESGNGFVMAMNDYLPVGLKGLLLIAFLGAYMSTISTQLNWGASYLTSDLYARFIRPSSEFKTEEKAQKHYILIARVFTLATMILATFATTQITSIDAAAKFMISCGAGLGLVVILRWYWWRINAWSEITATFTPFIVNAVNHYVLQLETTLSYNITVAVTTVAWLAVTFLTQPESKQTLSAFYNRVKPGGFWKGFSDESNKPSLLYNFLSWLSSIVFAYSLLFTMGKIIFQEWIEVIYYSIALLISGGLFLVFFRKVRD